LKRKKEPSDDWLEQVVGGRLTELPPRTEDERLVLLKMRTLRAELRAEAERYHLWPESKSLARGDRAAADRLVFALTLARSPRARELGESVERRRKEFLALTYGLRALAQAADGQIYQDPVAAELTTILNRKVAERRLPRVLIRADLGDMHGQGGVVSQPGAGSPRLDEPWQVWVPDAYRRFGADITGARLRLYLKSQHDCTISRTRAERAVKETNEAISQILASLDTVAEATADAMRDRKDWEGNPTAVEAGFGGPVSWEQGFRRCLAMRLEWPPLNRFSERTREAATEIVLGVMGRLPPEPGPSPNGVARS
jgi:hypothetical protein